MAIEQEILPFLTWLLKGSSEQAPALTTFLFAAAALALLGLVGGFLIAAVRAGPLAAGDATYRVVRRAVHELPSLSPRRVWALARLSIHETFRRGMLAVVLLFVVLLLFAPWFLGSPSQEPLKLYASFVLTTSMYLAVVFALLVSAFSLPGDIKSKTIHTVVTKPVRAGEIVLGRILGFTVVGTFLLLVMGVCGYVFVLRMLDHRHEIDSGDLVAASGTGEARGLRGETSLAFEHRHNVVVDADGHGSASSNLGHWHDVEQRETPSGQRHEVGPPRGFYRARVPIYGKLRFRDRTGGTKARGISVGNEWAYRSFIEGNSQAAAIWTFSDLRQADHPQGLNLEMTLRVFRTYKGQIEQGILGSLVLVNPTTGVQSRTRTFRAKDFYIDEQHIPLTLERREADVQAGQSEELDLFRDLVDDQGRLEVWIRCLDSAQYFGAAQADCYIRARDGKFWVNFLKGYVGIWTLMLVILSLGVMFSTFLSGPVALLATVTALVMGSFSEFIQKVTSGKMEGGGPLESLVRLVTQQNMVSELEQKSASGIIKEIDGVLNSLLHGIASVLPEFPRFNQTSWVALGFDIPWNIIGQSLLVGLAYLLGAFIAGYFFLRSGEVAK